MRFFISLVLFACFAASCTYEPTYDLTCSDEGAVDGDRECIDGVWVTADAGSADEDTDTCEPRQTQTICDEEGADCGDLTITECGQQRTVACGSCGADESCEDNVCVCIAQTDQELCDEQGATCGTLMLTDRCGDARNPDCGTCTGEDVCGGGGTPNTCACPGADDELFCMENAAECGVVTADDPVCGTERTVNCGECDAPDSCGGAGTPNQCGCMESEADFCDNLDLNCGMVSDTDSCGVDRTDIDCGSCTLPQTCGGGGTQFVCGCDESTICVDSGVECGTFDASPRCDNLGMVDCGNCGANGTCMQNACMCDDGYEVKGTSCVDVDECATSADDCDANANCTNEPGTFTCTCNDGYTGDGTQCSPLEPVIAEVVTGTGQNPVTTAPITGVDDDLYVAFIGLRTSAQTVDSVAGLGLTWTEAGLQCNASDEQRVGIWWARGTPQVGSDSIVVNMSDDPFATVVAVFRVDNVPASGSPGWTRFQNSNGPMGRCDSSNAENSYSFSYGVQDDNSLVLAGTAIFSRSHTAGNSWTEEVELHQSGSQGTEAGIAVQSQYVGATGNITVDGSFNGQNNWVTGLIEISGL